MKVKQLRQLLADKIEEADVILTTPEGAFSLAAVRQSGVRIDVVYLIAVEED